MKPVNRRALPPALAIGGVLLLVCQGGAADTIQPAARMVLEDFQARDSDGFPAGWKAQRNETKARQTYRVKAEQGETFLTGKEADQRIYKRIAWDPKAMPTLTWHWRLKAAPSGADFVAAVFVSLDTDLMIIPVSTKYVWSAAKAKGAVTEGGMFGASEVVLRSGLQPVGEWVEERVNAYEDFKRLHKHEPADKAWGISLLAGPGVEVDFGPIAASAP